MNSLDELYLQVRDRVIEAKNIAVITHINPDGDCLGSSMALCEFIKKYGKNAKIFNEQGCPPSFDFIKGNIEFSTQPEPDGSKYDLVIFIDCGSIDRAGEPAWVYKTCDYIINIDHHATNTMYGDLNIVDPKAAATGLIIYDMFSACNVAIDKRAAELLYMAIATDTGNFSYANTDKRAHHVAGELMEKGVDVATLSQKLFRATTYNRLKLTCKALETLKLYCGGKIAVLNITKAMFAATGTDASDSEGFVSYARDIEGVEIAVVLRDTTDGKLVKVSLRSNSNVDVSKIAEEFGGGGHFNAAGCSIEGKIPDVEEIIIERLSKVVQ